MSRRETTIAELLRMHTAQLTRNEARAAQALLANYPLAGLQPIARFAKEAGVSAQSILRLLSKLDFDTYGAFQDRLRVELATVLQSPRGRLRAHERGETAAPDFVAAFSERVARNVSQTLSKVHRAELDRAARLIGDARRRVLILGGRLTESIAQHLAVHLQLIRPDVTLLSGQSAGWPDKVLDVTRNTTLIAFDVRRYQGDVVRFCALAAARGARVVLLTDRADAPAAKAASLVFVADTASLSAWDSFAGLLALSELIMARLSDARGAALQARIEELDAVRDGFFGKSPEG